MHFIRFLKVPRVVQQGKDQKTLNAKVTITTDLGESFLSADVGVEVLLEDLKGNILPSLKPIPYSWMGRNGMRALGISIPVPRRHAGDLKMWIRPIDKGYSVEDFSAILGTSSSIHGGIVSVHSTAINLNSSHSAEALAERRFKTNSGSISIWEETGESIARHIWDAGLVLSAYISLLSSHIQSSSTSLPNSFPRLPILETLLKKKDLNVLELGAGCGIVGITLDQSLHTLSQITLTDLPEASEILTLNLSPSSKTPIRPKSTISHQVLNWSSSLPPNISSTAWDLVAIADCTYNPDVVPDLVTTLTKLRDGQRNAEMNQENKNEVVVLLAMKVRHESEMVFFELMSGEGWIVREKGVVGLGVVGAEEDEGEEIEIFVFGGGKGDVEGRRR